MAYIGTFTVSCNACGGSWDIKNQEPEMVAHAIAQHASCDRHSDVCVSFTVRYERPPTLEAPDVDRRP